MKFFHIPSIVLLAIAWLRKIVFFYSADRLKKKGIEAAPGFAVSDRGCKIVLETVTPTRRFRLKKVLLATPHHATIDLQKSEIAPILMNSLGADYIPNRLASMMGGYDVFEAFRQFLSLMSFDFMELLHDDSQKNLFKEMVELLQEAEPICQESALLEDFPLYYVIATHRDYGIGYCKARVKDCMERLREAAALAQLLESRSIAFPAFEAQFLTTARQWLVHWHELDGSELEELRETFQDWALLQDSYEELQNRFTNLIHWIHTRIDAAEWEYYPAVEAMVKEFEQGRQKIEKGETEAAEGIEKLNELQNELEILAATLEDKHKEEGASSGARSCTTEKVQQWLRSLGLHYPDDLDLAVIKKTHRRLIKRYHTDCEGGDLEKCKEINPAYTNLIAFLRTREA